ncbi:AraC family transcriptional regulator [Oricola cellulosilytica]|nr:AraC family transcriptional regulator [Oricola cellulosilytica]
MTERPELVVAAPRVRSGESRKGERGMETDVLSEVLRAVRLKGTVFFDVRATSPWAAEAPAAKAIARVVMPNCEHVIGYHIVAAGACWAKIRGLDSDAVRLSRGDLIAFPHGNGHRLASTLEEGAPDFSVKQLPTGGRALPLVVDSGGGGPEKARLFCGFFGCDNRPFNPLIEALPPIIHVRADECRNQPAIRGLMNYVLTEAASRGPGSDTVLSKTSELLFIEIVRAYVARLPPDGTGWFAGLRDPHVGRTLTLMHRKPSKAWTMNQLAKEAGLSRTMLAERFRNFVGVSPMSYLRQWRMQSASAQLLGGGSTLGAIAAAAGYSSEAAFSRAFKKTVGVAPAHWKRVKQDGPSAQLAAGG